MNLLSGFAIGVLAAFGALVIVAVWLIGKYLGPIVKAFGRRR